MACAAPPTWSAVHHTAKYLSIYQALGIQRHSHSSRGFVVSGGNRKLIEKLLGKLMGRKGAAQPLLGEEEEGPGKGRMPA
jgi:hypothetical protein